jgi:hypothetical protein
VIGTQDIVIESSYNVRRQVFSGLISARKCHLGGKSCQVTLDKSAKLLIYNLYVESGAMQNCKNGLSYCPDGGFFLI